MGMPGTTSATTRPARAYRWGEDGLAGFSDDKSQLCFALALWNGVDPILKERLYGITNSEANHGEDVKEYYFYLDSTPTHSYMKFLYKYPQAAFPYEDLKKKNQARSREEMEYELLDTGIFDEDRYFDVFVEYAKELPEDILIKITVWNRGPEAASLHVLPTLWFRNTWSWQKAAAKPRMKQAGTFAGASIVAASHRDLGTTYLYCENEAQVLFTENETNSERIFGTPNNSPYVKDGINNTIVNGQTDAVNPEQEGTKAAAHYEITVGGGESKVIRLRLTQLTPEVASYTYAEGDAAGEPFGSHFDKVMALRLHEADGFYDSDHAGRHGRRPGQRHAPGAGRHVVEQAALLLRSGHLARRARLPSLSQSIAPEHSQPRLVPHDQRRHHLDAG